MDKNIGDFVFQGKVLQSISSKNGKAKQLSMKRRYNGNIDLTMNHDISNINKHQGDLIMICL